MTCQGLWRPSVGGRIGPGELKFAIWGAQHVVAKSKKQKNKELKANKSKKPLCQHTEDALENYFATLNGDRPGDLYDLVMGEVERPLFQAVMNYTDGNQSQAAGILGINRGTLRKKLRTYSLIQ